MADVSPVVSGPRTSTVTDGVSRLAGRHGGVVSRTQLARQGMTAGAIARAVRASRLHRIYPAVYAVGHRALTIEGCLVAALLHAGPGAALSHATAAWWWGLTDAAPRRIHVSAPGRRRSRHEVCVHHPRSFDRQYHRHLPVTPVPRTLLDCAAAFSFNQLRRALAEADYLGLLNDREVTRALGPGHHGAACLRQALAKHRPELARTRSVLEERFLALCETTDLLLLEVNATVAGLEVDAVWRARGVVVELDGQTAHGGDRSVGRDRDRELRLRAAGYVVLRYSWEQITRAPERVIADLTPALIPPAPSGAPGSR